MEFFRVIIEPRAAGDLEAIHAFISEDSEQNAAGMVEKILDGIERLRVFPGRARVRGQGKRLRAPVRSVAVWPYIIYFRVYEGDRVVRVLHIRHGARRRPRRFD